MVYFPSLFGDYGIPTSAWAVEASSPLTPISNYIAQDSYGFGSFGLGAGIFGGGGNFLGGAPYYGSYGLFSSPSIVPVPIFTPIPYLFSHNETSDWAPSNFNIADYLNLDSAQTPANSSQVDEAAEDEAVKEQPPEKKKKKKPPELV